MALLHPERTELSNGLTVLTLTDPGTPVTSFQVWYRGGSRLDPPGRSGMAHLFEHLLLEPPSDGSAGHRDVVEAAGGGSGAYTTWDALVLIDTVPSDSLELCARLEAQRMGSLTFDPGTIERVRAFVRNERTSQIESQPVARGMEELIGLAFPRHPYGWPTYGRPTDLDSLTVEACRAYYRERFAPDQAVLVIAGPASHAEVLAVVRPHFEKLLPSRFQPPVPARDPESTSALRSAVTAPTTVPVLLVGYRSTAGASADQRALEIAQHLLSDGASARLARRLVEEKRSAFAVGGSSQERLDPGLWTLFVYARPGAPASEIEDDLFAEIARLGTDGPTAEELAASRDYLETKFLYRSQTSEGRAQVVGQANVVTGDPDAAARRADGWQAVTAEEVRRVVSTYLAPPMRRVIWLTPGSEGGR